MVFYLFNVFNFIPQAEVEESLKRIESHKGVIGTLVVNADGKSLCINMQFIFLYDTADFDRKDFFNRFRYSHQDNFR